MQEKTQLKYNILDIFRHQNKKYPAYGNRISVQTEFELLRIGLDSCSSIFNEEKRRNSLSTSCLVSKIFVGVCLTYNQPSSTSRISEFMGHYKNHGSLK